MVFPAWEIFKQDRLSVQAVCQINAYLPFSPQPLKIRRWKWFPRQ